MMVGCHVAGPRVGLGPALALGWVAFLAVLTPLTRVLWSQSVPSAQQSTLGDQAASPIGR